MLKVGGRRKSPAKVTASEELSMFPVPRGRARVVLGREPYEAGSRRQDQSWYRQTGEYRQGRRDDPEAETRWESLELVRHGEETPVADILSYGAGRKLRALASTPLTAKMTLALRRTARFLSQQEHALQRGCPRDGWGPGPSPGLKRLTPLRSEEEGAVGCDRQVPCLVNTHYWAGSHLHPGQLISFSPRSFPYSISRNAVFSCKISPQGKVVTTRDRPVPNPVPKTCRMDGSR